MAKILPVLLILLSITLPTKAALQTGRKVPEFQSKTARGYTLSYQKHFKNKVTLVVLSNYCSVELAGVWAIPLYYAFRKHTDFRFAFVFSRSCLPAYIPRAFVTRSLQNAQKSLRLPYILMDWDNKVSRKLKADAQFTQIYLIDQQGTLQKRLLLKDPFTSPDTLKQSIQKLLN